MLSGLFDAERLSSESSSEDVLDGAGCHADVVSLSDVSPRGGGLESLLEAFGLESVLVELEPLFEESGPESLLVELEQLFEPGSESVLLLELKTVEFKLGGVGSGKPAVESVELEPIELLDGISGGESVELRLVEFVGGKGRSPGAEL